MEMKDLQDRKEYIVKCLSGSNSINVDGNLDKPEWKKTEPIRDFIFPWENRKAPFTEFKAFCDENWFYFSFLVDDAELVIKNECLTKKDIIEEDRVELFFALDWGLKIYYQLEIDPRGRVYSSRASFYRQSDLSWDCKGLKTAGKIFQDGYSMECAIPLSTLSELGFSFNKTGDKMIAGVYRAEFNYDADGKIEEHWISWVDPEADKPDFHIPSSFGVFKLEA